jgi:hypothetical protein
MLMNLEIWHRLPIEGEEVAPTAAWVEEQAGLGLSA